MGKKKSSSTTGPSSAALGYLTPASAAVNDAYTGNFANLAGIGSTLSGAFNNYAGGMGEGLAPAQDYTNGVLSGKWLNSNPFTDQLVDNASDDVTNRVNAAFGMAGRTGSGAHTESLAKGLGDAVLGFRAGDYNTERARMDGAVGQAAGLNQAGNQNLGTLLQIGQGAAELPYLGSNTLARNMTSLWGGSNTSTQSPSMLGSLLGLGGSALSAWAGGGFK